MERASCHPNSEISVGRSLTSAPNIRYQQCDAFDLSQIVGSFNAAFHFNFINHVSYKNWAALVENLHSKLEPGAIVVMGGQLYQGSDTDGVDHFAERGAENGERYMLTDNIPDENKVQEVLGNLITDLEFIVDHRWLAKYVVT